MIYQTRNPMVPERLWGTTIAPQEVAPQTVGCSICLVQGIYEPPEIIFYIDGTSVCRTHIPGNKDD